MSKGKMPAVKEKAQMSHSQNHPDKNLSKVLNLFLFAAAGRALWFPRVERAS